MLSPGFQSVEKTLIPPFGNESGDRGPHDSWSALSPHLPSRHKREFLAPMAKNVQSTMSEKAFIMSTDNLIRQVGRPVDEWREVATAEHSFTVSVMKSMHANRHRIFQALTLPEYIEAWFSAPDALPGYMVVSARQACISISYSRLDGDRCRFLGSYKVFRRSKILLTWKRDSYFDSSPSLVTIRLVGDFESTTVHLTHVGLSESEQVWYRALWERSLKKLACLF